MVVIWNRGVCGVVGWCVRALGLARAWTVAECGLWIWTGGSSVESVLEKMDSWCMMYKGKEDGSGKV
ncbi:hypothetical protein N7519_003546 [Penicillium mononematosum]|uniref:uncharacterized protein n=1 Tax=Penicillium mononematosum TaxID=268346 RepID=UPI002546B7D4|nr:uncharacterized protein N7519_003546 [Penicillium mononematosum]KAJ6188638.1 hypothetical protein N7519_003546 [Penicillium mononematosum]